MEVTYNMEYRRIHPHPSPPSPPSHTHTYTNSIPLDSWSISRDNTTPLFSLCVHRDAPSDKPPIKIPPSTFPPHSGFYVLCYYISYKRQHGSVCVLARCGVQSSRIFVALWPTCASLRHSVRVCKHPANTKQCVCRKYTTKQCVCRKYTTKQCVCRKYTTEIEENICTGVDLLPVVVYYGAVHLPRRIDFPQLTQGQALPSPIAKTLFAKKVCVRVCMCLSCVCCCACVGQHG